MSANPFRDFAQFALRIVEEERRRNCSPARLRRPLGEMQAHVTAQELELGRHRNAALAAGRKTGHHQHEVERRVVGLLELCIKLLLWERDAPRRTAEQRRASGSWTADPPSDYLVGLINQLYPACDRVNDLGAAYDGWTLTDRDQERAWQGEGEKPRRRGRKPDTDPRADQRIAEAWATGQHKTYAQLAEAKGITEREVKLALDRTRWRQRSSKGGRQRRSK
jgi:hypothetical protein